MIVGIDLGTTNSAVAVFRNGAVEVIPNSLGHALTPSAVSVDDDGEFIIGLAARERQVTHPDQTVTAIKRLMGVRCEIEMGGRTFRPEELAALILASLKRDAEAYLGQPVDEAVVTVPAYFNDQQRRATRRAAELAGLKVERLVNEPTAAALAYGIADRDRETRLLVFDLGGGTFDVTLVEMFEGVLDVRASAGDTRLGGADFNELLLRRMAGRVPGWARAVDEDPRLRERIRMAAERARRALSDAPEAVMSVVWGDQTHEMAITEAEFAAAAEPLLARLRQPALRALSDGRLITTDIDEIVLVGGATRMPCVRRAVARMFGRFPSMSIDPAEAVVRGAAIQAGLKARDAALSEIVLTDVCPFSLGIQICAEMPNGQVDEDVFDPILERNVTIPASRIQRYSLRGGRSVLALAIFQGEARKASNNLRLGTLHVAPPADGSRAEWVDVRFTYDVDGLLDVDAQLSTGERAQLMIAGDDGFSRAELAGRRAALAALKVHPRDTDANRAALARGARCFEEALGSRREAVSRLIHNFEGVLASQDPRAAERARGEFLHGLDTLEGASFL